MGGSNSPSGQYSNSLSLNAQLWYRITDRLSWNLPLPALAYRFGDPGAAEVITSMGLKFNGWSGSAGPNVGFGTGVDARIWTAPNQSILLGAGVYMPVYKTTSGSWLDGMGMGNAIDPSVHAGYSWTVAHVVTLSAQLGYVQDYYRGTLTSAWIEPRGTVSVRVAPNASVDVSGLFADDVKQNLGTYRNLSIGTTIAF